MKRRFAVIMAALLIAAMAGCSQSGTSSTAEQSTVQSSADSSVAESAESEISEAESSVVSEVTSTESSEEKSETSAAESSENKSKTESSKPKNEESSKPENSKAETSKTETSKTESSKTETSKTESSKAEEPKVTGISIDQSSLSLTSGSTQELNAYILWSNNTSSYQGIQWSSSNTSVAVVSSSGYVTAKSAGTATITASYGSFKKTCTVTVKAAQQTQPSQPSGGGNSGSGNGGSSGNGSSGNGGSTSKPSDGGNTTIYEQVPNVRNQDFDKPITGKTPIIQFSYNAITIRKGDDNTVLDVMVTDGNQSYKNGYAGLKWTSSNPSVAYFDYFDGGAFHIVGKSNGTATITATYKGVTASCVVTVAENQLAVDPNDSPLEAEAKKYGFDLNVYDDARLHGVFWSQYGKSEGIDTKKVYPEKTFDKSSSARIKVKSNEGYEVYEVQELLTQVNKRRALKGLQPLRWTGYTAENAKGFRQWFENSDEERQERWMSEHPGWFKNGKLTEDGIKQYYAEEATAACKSIDACLRTRTLNHISGGSNINGDRGYYNPERWIDTFEMSPAHWDGLMDPDAETFYALAAPATVANNGSGNNGYTVCIWVG